MFVVLIDGLKKIKSDMVYGVTMLEDFYVAYKGKLEHVRAVLKRPLVSRENLVCPSL